MRVALLIVSCAFVLAACGNKGDLYLRDPAAPPPLSAEELAIARAESQQEAAEYEASRARPQETLRERRQRERSQQRGY
ncbi:MAG: lipoprotein [Xanthomonadales bacterium]|nr:lipoprotein [Xanthomonadales bacterium]